MVADLLSPEGNAGTPELELELELGASNRLKGRCAQPGSPCTPRFVGFPALLPSLMLHLLHHSTVYRAGDPDRSTRSESIGILCMIRRVVWVGVARCSHHTPFSCKVNTAGSRNSTPMPRKLENTCTVFVQGAGLLSKTRYSRSSMHDTWPRNTWRALHMVFPGQSQNICKILEHRIVSQYCT